MDLLVRIQALSHVSYAYRQHYPKTKVDWPFLYYAWRVLDAASHYHLSNKRSLPDLLKLAHCVLFVQHVMKLNSKAMELSQWKSSSLARVWSWGEASAYVASTTMCGRFGFAEWVFACCCYALLSCKDVVW